MEPFSIIIPAYNEEKTIGNLVRTVATFKSTSEILVINDGSKDRTKEILVKTKKELPQNLASKIGIYNLEQNRGHGFACCFGIEKSSCPILVFLDGDITSILEEDVMMMVTPLIKKKADMVLGVGRTNGNGKFYDNAFKTLTGERAVWRKDLIDKVEVMKHKKFGFVIFLNSFYARKRVQIVELPNLYLIIKFAKMSILASLVSYAKEAREMARELIRQKVISPAKSRIILKKINEFLKKAKNFGGL